MKEDIDLIEIHYLLKQGMAICMLMTNLSEDADVSGDCISALGLELYDKFSEISKKLDC